ncbi:response regulator [Marinomonas sp. THO17]|uniref:response regulator n=1 Tax=Marinomonas sp. THO17 TaxID=3149048 RepID=UPI00336C14BC
MINDELKVLVVEDSPVVLKVLNHLLSQNPKFVPVLCACYEEAKAKIENASMTFFAAIVDLHLPDAENGEIVDLVLSHQIPCVVLTGNFDDYQRLNLLNKGVLDYITKDSRYSFNHVIKVIDRLRKNQDVKVLVAEDSSTSRLFIKILLEQYRFKVVEAEDGREALAKLEEDHSIRMLITDYNMPHINGYDLVRMLRHNTRFQDLVIIGLSSEGDSSLSAKFIKAGANDFLKKPFYHEEFNCRVVHNLESQEMLETIRELANIDSLTRLKNRRYLFDDGEKMFRKAMPNASFAMLDLDHFKKVNDTYGHVVGDALLQAIGQEVLAHFPNLLACRFGGEEFCVAADESVESLMPKLEAFMDSIRVKEFTEAKIHVTFSIGVCGGEFSSLDDAIRIADDNLYRAKRLGRDRIVTD